MAFDSLQDRLTKSLKNIAGKGKLSERNMEDTLQKIVSRMYPDLLVTSIWTCNDYRNIKPYNL